MPIFDTVSRCYQLPSGFTVCAEIARGEVISSTPGATPVMSDADMERVMCATDATLPGDCYMVIESGMFLVVSTEFPSLQELQDFATSAGSLFGPANFTDATWPAGGTPYTITADGVINFTETDRENIEVAVQKAMQATGLYYDVASVVRNANTITITLDETNKPYDAGWDSVLSHVAAWYGGELP